MENWKDVLGFEGYYEVSDLGNVKRKKGETIYKDGRVAHFSETLLKPSKNKKGYLVVYLSKNSKKYTLTIHKIVASTWIPNPEKKTTVNHINCDKTNNSVENLEWMTNKENMQHAFKNGLYKERDKTTINNLGIYANGMKGELNPTSKLTEIQVSEIRALKGILTAKAISKLYSVSHSLICGILNNKMR